MDVRRGRLSVCGPCPGVPWSAQGGTYDPTANEVCQWINAWMRAVWLTDARILASSRNFGNAGGMVSCGAYEQESTNSEEHALLSRKLDARFEDAQIFHNACLSLVHGLWVTPRIERACCTESGEENLSSFLNCGGD